MGLRLILFAATLISLACMSAYSAVLQNERFRAAICEDWEGTHPPGSLLEFQDLDGTIGDVLADMDYALKVTAGSFMPSPGIFEALSDSEGVFASSSMSWGSAALPVRVTFQYRLTGQGLNIAWRVDCDAEVTFSSGLHCCWDLSPWQNLCGFNQVGQTDTLLVSGISSTLTRALKAAWKLADSEKSLWILQPDPLQARWNLSPGVLKQEWLSSRPPNTTFPTSQSPPIASILSPEHSIWGNLSLEISTPETGLPGLGLGWMHLSGIPGGGEQGFMYMWDAFPLSWDGYWNPLTTPNNPSTPVGSKIVQLLTNHPAMKMVLLIAMDSQLSGYPFRPNLPSWSVPQSFVCIDTMDQIEGNGALTLSHYDSSTTWVTQNVSCVPEETLHLTGWVRVDSIITGWAGVTLMGDSVGIQPLSFVFAGPQDWTFCEAEINTGPNMFLTVQVGMTGGPGKARFDDLRLERPGSPGNLLNNAGFNDFSFYVTYDGEGLQWWHAHGQHRLATMAPQAYLDWLKLVEGDSVNYGWEDRACLGLHSYHHTPNELYPLGGQYEHEFNYYDPDGDSARFYMIHRDLLDCGLSEQSFKVFRFPGFKHQLSAVRECARHEVSLVDRGSYSYGQCSLGATILPEGAVWETNSNWWTDENTWNNVDNVYRVLDRGELILAGGHPGSTFPPSNPAQFDLINGAFNDLEARYPNLEYFFPADMARFCEESRTWWGAESRSMPSTFEFCFYGSSSQGQTIVAHVQDIESILLPPLVDSQPVLGEIRGNRLFIGLPDLPLGEHMVILEKGVGVPPISSRAFLPAQVRLGLPFPNPCNAWLTFPVELPQAMQVEYRLTDILGRTALSGKLLGEGGEQRISVNVDVLPSGIYLFTVRSGDLVKRGKINVLK